MEAVGVEAVGPSLGDVTHAGVTPAQYLDPDIASGLPWRDLPVVDGRDPSLAELLAIAADKARSTGHDITWVAADAAASRMSGKAIVEFP